MTIKLPPIETDPTFWVDLAIDRELNLEQRNQLFQFLDTNPELNREFTRRFLLEQSIAESVQDAFRPSSLPVQKPHLDLEKKEPQNKSLWSVFIAASLIGLLLGWVAHGLNAPDVRDSRAEIEQQITPMLNDISQSYEEVYELMYQQRVAELEDINKQTIENVQKTLARNPTLIEVENSKDRAVYYTKHRIPNFLLDAIVLAGHRTTIKQQTLKIESGNDLIEYPIHSLEIEKNALVATAQTAKENQ